jgi:hypothetical protein
LRGKKKEEKEEPRRKQKGTVMARGKSGGGHWGKGKD